MLLLSSKYLRGTPLRLICPMCCGIRPTTSGDIIACPEAPENFRSGVVVNRLLVEGVWLPLSLSAAAFHFKSSEIFISMCCQIMRELMVHGAEPLAVVPRIAAAPQDEDESGTPRPATTVKGSTFSTASTTISSTSTQKSAGEIGMLSSLRVVLVV